DPSPGGVDREPGGAAHRRCSGREIAATGPIEVGDADLRRAVLRPVDLAGGGVYRDPLRLAHGGASDREIGAARVVQGGEREFVPVVVAPVDAIDRERRRCQATHRGDCERRSEPAKDAARGYLSHLVSSRRAETNAPGASAPGGG